jgi:hypothetical protein
VKNKQTLEKLLRKKPLNLPRNLVVAEPRRKLLMVALLRMLKPAVTAKSQLGGLLAKDHPRTALLVPPPSTLPIFRLSIQMTRYLTLFG